MILDFTGEVIDADDTRRLGSTDAVEPTIGLRLVFESKDGGQ